MDNHSFSIPGEPESKQVTPPEAVLVILRDILEINRSVHKLNSDIAHLLVPLPVTVEGTDFVPAGIPRGQIVYLTEPPELRQIIPPEKAADILQKVLEQNRLILRQNADISEALLHPQRMVTYADLKSLSDEALAEMVNEGQAGDE